MPQFTVPIAEYVTLEREHVQYIVYDMVPRPGIVVLIGAPFAGKSFLAVQLAHTIARGTRFLGRDTVRGRVLYLILESELVWRDRIDKLLRCGYLATDDDIHVPHPDTKPPSVNILTNAGRTWLRSSIEECDPDLVIIDPLREVHNAVEDDSTEMKVVGDALVEVVGQRACVIIHHTNKLDPDLVRMDPVRAARGSNYITGKADTVWMLMADKKNPDNRATMYVVPRFVEREMVPLQRTDKGLWLAS